MREDLPLPAVAETDSAAEQPARDGAGFARPYPASEVLEHLDAMVRRGQVDSLASLPTGFPILDKYLDGGLRPGDLVLVGGAQGVGKTTLTLQMARNLVARTQATCCYACYEHDEPYLLQRLISQESAIGRGQPYGDGLPVNQLRELLLAAGRGVGGLGEMGLEDVLRGHPAATTALGRIQAFGRRLYLLKASSGSTDVPALARLVREWKERYGPRVVLFVDYLQKVPVFPAGQAEAERVTQVTSGLKELALSENVPVVAVVAADQQGLQAQRLRIYHLRGSSSLMYESDVVLILNNKYRVVSKQHITFNYHRAQELKSWVVCTIEKNRAGRDLVDLEFRALFPFGALDPDGRLVTDQLIEERIEDL